MTEPTPIDYGFVNKIPTNLKKGDYYGYVRYSVARTGKLEQFYTLYRYQECCLSGYWFRKSCQFIKNLSTNKTDAIKKVEKVVKGGHDDTGYDFFDSPQVEYLKFSAFDLNWKNGKKCYYAEPDKNFWELWKKDKTAIKDAGFWVSKFENTFYVFHKI